MRKRFGHCFGQPLDACFVSRVSGKKLVRLVPSRLLHPFPDADGFMGVIAGIGRKQQSDVISLRFMRPAERKEDTYLGADP